MSEVIIHNTGIEGDIVLPAFPEVKESPCLYAVCAYGANSNELAVIRQKMVEFAHEVEVSPVDISGLEEKASELIANLECKVINDEYPLLEICYKGQLLFLRREHAYVFQDKKIVIEDSLIYRVNLKVECVKPYNTQRYNDFIENVYDYLEIDPIKDYIQVNSSARIDALYRMMPNIHKGNRRIASRILSDFMVKMSDKILEDEGYVYYVKEKGRSKKCVKDGYVERSTQLRYYWGKWAMENYIHYYNAYRNSGKPVDFFRTPESFFTANIDNWLETGEHDHQASFKNDMDDVYELSDMMSSLADDQLEAILWDSNLDMINLIDKY